MQLTIFAKTKKTAEGRTFRIYLSRLINKNSGEELPVRVQFREGIPVPSLYPINIIVEKKDANLSTKKFTDDEGKEHVTHTLWVNSYQTSPEPFVDHSLDDYE